ncbi:MAG: hypothetical protein ACPGUC_04815, partial [Gammaproteobacteria bacterium]
VNPPARAQRAALSRLAEILEECLDAADRVEQGGPNGLVVLFAAGGLLLPQGGGVLAVLVPLLAIMLGLLLFVLSSLVFPSAVLEPASGLAAFKRGWALARGRRKMVVGNMILVIVLLVVLIVVAALVTQGLSLVFLALGEIGAVLVVVLNMVLNLLLNAVAYFFISGFQSLMYYERRIIDDHWLPAWEEVPDLSWPTRGAGSDAVSSAGLKPWLEMVLLGVLSVGVLALLGVVMGISAA